MNLIICVLGLTDLGEDSKIYKNYFRSFKLLAKL